MTTKLHRPAALRRLLSMIPGQCTKIASASWHTCAVLGAMIGGAACISIGMAGWREGLFGAALAAICVLIAYFDWRSYVIPNELNALGLSIGLVAAAGAGSGNAMLLALAMAALRAAVAALLFLALRTLYYWWRREQGLGLGDVKLAAVAGVWLDWPMLPIAIETAAIAVLGAYISRQLIFRRPLIARARLPFGVFLAPAIWLCWLLAMSAHLQS